MPIWRALAVIIAAKLSSVPPRYSAIATATSLADLVTTARSPLSTSIESPRLKPILVGGARAGMVRHRDQRRPGDAAGFHRLEQQIKRHHLGQRRRDAGRFGRRLIKHRPARPVDDDRRILRRVESRHYRGRCRRQHARRRATADGQRKDHNQCSVPGHERPAESDNLQGAYPKCELTAPELRCATPRRADKLLAQSALPVHLCVKDAYQFRCAGASTRASALISFFLATIIACDGKPDGLPWCSPLS